VALDPRTRTLNSLGYSLLNRHRGSRSHVLSEPEARDIIARIFPIPKQRRTNTDPVGPYLDALTVCRLGLDASPGTSPDASLARARVLSGNGVLAHYQGDYGRAGALCQEALILSLTLDDGKGIAEAQTGIGLVHRARGDYPEAEALFREALIGYERLNDEADVAHGIDRLAMHFVTIGDDAQARPLFEDSLARFRRLGDAHAVDRTATVRRSVQERLHRLLDDFSWGRMDQLFLGRA